MPERKKRVEKGLLLPLCQGGSDRPGGGAANYMPISVKDANRHC